MNRRVVKFGGSLFVDEEVGPKLKRWLNDNTDMQNIIVVGGGKTADAMRGMGRLLNNFESHEFACRAMDLNAGLLACYLKEVRLCTKIEQLRESEDQV